MSINSPKTIFETALTDTVASGGRDKEQVGTVRFGHDGRIYRWVQNTHTVALTVGDTVVHDGATDTADMFNYVEDGEASPNCIPFQAGVAISAIPSSGFGWIQIGGYCAAINHLGGTAGGSAVAVGEALGQVDAQLYCARLNAAGAAPLYTRHFVALEAVATATTPAAATIKGLVCCYP